MICEKCGFDTDRPCGVVFLRGDDVVQFIELDTARCTTCKRLPDYIDVSSYGQDGWGKMARIFYRDWNLPEITPKQYFDNVKKELIAKGYQIWTPNTWKKHSVIKKIGKLGNKCVYCDKEKATIMKFGVNMWDKAKDGRTIIENWAVCKNCYELIDAQGSVSMGVSMQMNALKNKDDKLVEALQEPLEKAREKVKKLSNGEAIDIALIKDDKGNYNVHDGI